MQLEAKNLGKRFGKDWVLRNLNWKPEQGKVYAIIGLNGAGKTTLLNLLSGLYAGSEGEVWADGDVLRRESVAARQQIFFLPDFPVVMPQWTLYRHLASLLVMYGKDPEPAKDIFLDLVNELDLKDVVSKPFGAMSRGQLYKSALLCLRVLAPKYWLLDEPFASGVDAHGLIVMRRWIREASESGSTIIYTTQLPTLATDFAQHILLLHGTAFRFFDVRDEQAVDASGEVVELEAYMESLRCGK